MSLVQELSIIKEVQHMQDQLIMKVQKVIQVKFNSMLKNCVQDLFHMISMSLIVDPLQRQVVVMIEDLLILAVYFANMRQKPSAFQVLKTVTVQLATHKK